jgi:DNA-binding transcriptional LysR family regulator
MDIDLRHLRVICAVADAGSVTKAAASLGLAQPALTTQLKRIERSLGGALFVRDRRGARLTPLGDLVLARARVLIPALKGLQQEAVHLAHGGQPNRYRIGATNGPICGGLVQRLALAHPAERVSVHATWSAEEISGMTVAGTLDFALVGVCGDTTPAPQADLVWRPVCVDPVWVLVSEQHRLAARDEVTLADLAGEHWANAPGDGCFNDCFAAACAREGFTPRAAYEMDVGSCIDLVTSGAAVVLCQGTVRHTPGVVVLPIAGTPLYWRHLLGWDPAGPAARVADEVFDVAVRTYLDIVRQRPRYADWLGAHHRFGPQILRAA